MGDRVSNLVVQVSDLLERSRQTWDPALAQDYRQMARDLISLHGEELRVALALLDVPTSEPIRLSE